MRTLLTPVTELPKIRPVEIHALRRMGIETVGDLLLHLPFRWESFGAPVLVRNAVHDEQVTVIGTLTAVDRKVSRYKRVALTEGALRDESGAILKVTWFKMPWIARDYRVGDRVVLAGKLRADGFGYQMVNPRVEKLDPAAGPARVGGEMPRYHLSGGISDKKITDLVAHALPAAEEMVDIVPAAVRDRQGLLSIADAVRAGHRPERPADWKLAVRSLQFQDLLVIQLAQLVSNRRLSTEPARPIPYRQDVIEAFKAGLGFELTGAQRRATWEIYRDLALAAPMNRLLNGDVGSGKTAVAAAAVAMTHAAGLQSVVMAPTEILARQHLHKFRAYLEQTFPGLSVELLVSGLPAAERRRVVTAVASGHTALLVGTHALIEDAVEIADLGLAVVDEQHRFGTRQREQLRSKGTGRPHFLAMTATPIPRSLALALYGDMSLSTLDELPPGRTPIQTSVLTPAERGDAEALIRREVAAGRQAFVICPLIEESEKLEVKAATAEHLRLQTVFPGLRVALVHGRLKEKDAVMRGFAAGEYDILVATAVVEVGVDIPNASVMLIEGAERFGLAQLHQFRGRVGRGAAASHCILLSDDPGDKALDRLHLLARENDGFELARMDMKQRGMGELMGARQHGMSDLMMQALLEPELLNQAHLEAKSLFAEDPGLESQPGLLAAVEERLEMTSVS